MKIIVNEKNKDRIAEEITKAEGKARERRISYRSIVDAVTHIEKHLGIPKKDMLGIVVDVDDHAQDFPNAYKYTPSSTHFVVMRVSSGWALTFIGRCATRRGSQRYITKLTDVAKESILQKYIQFV